MISNQEILQSFQKCYIFR